jgi:hypothetical protein
VRQKCGTGEMLGDNERTERVLFGEFQCQQESTSWTCFSVSIVNRTVTVLSKIINSVPDTSVIFGTLISGERGHK